MSSSDGVDDQAKPNEPTPRSGPKATYPAERSPASRRRWFWISTAAVIVAGFAVAIAGYFKFGDPDVSGQATAHEILGSDSVAVQYTVNRSDPGKAVACVVRARAQDGAEVGRREVLIPAGNDIQVGARTVVYTSRPPVIGEVFGCTTSVPPYLHPEQ